MILLTQGSREMGQGGGGGCLVSISYVGMSGHFGVHIASYLKLIN